MTKRIKFTQAAVDNLSAPDSGRVTVWDATLPGFGMRVAAPRPSSREGRKTWIAMGRVDGKAVMETIGTLAQVPKVDKARDLARAAFSKMKGGTRPIEERRAESARRVAAVEAAAVEGRFAAVAERFLDEFGRAKGWAPKYATEFRRILDHDIIPRWGERPIRSITKHDVNELLEAKASSRDRARKGMQGGAAIQANRTLTRLRTLFAWGVAQELIDVDPSAGVLARAKEQARDRVLSDDEIVWFWHGAERAGPSGVIFRLLLLTAQRENEVAGMRWSEIDLDKRAWIIPRERTKSDRGHIVHLSEFAAEIIEVLPRLGDLVFPTRTGRVISSFDKAKGRVDAAMTAQLREASGNPDAEVEPWIVHDLRRTATTAMADKLKVTETVADKILNHVAGKTVSSTARIYNRAQYIDERRAALEALGRFVEELVRPGGTRNVVDLRRGDGVRRGRPAL
jgi:integrase